MVDFFAAALTRGVGLYLSVRAAIWRNTAVSGGTLPGGADVVRQPRAELLYAAYRPADAASFRADRARFCACAGPAALARPAAADVYSGIWDVHRTRVQWDS